MAALELNQSFTSIIDVKEAAKGIVRHVFAVKDVSSLQKMDCKPRGSSKETTAVVKSSKQLTIVNPDTKYAEYFRTMCEYLRTLQPASSLQAVVDVFASPTSTPDDRVNAVKYFSVDMPDVDMYITSSSMINVEWEQACAEAERAASAVTRFLASPSAPSVFQLRVDHTLAVKVKAERALQDVPVEPTVDERVDAQFNIDECSDVLLPAARAAKVQAKEALAVFDQQHPDILTIDDTVDTDDDAAGPALRPRRGEDTVASDTASLVEDRRALVDKLDFAIAQLRRAYTQVELARVTINDIRSACKAVQARSEIERSVVAATADYSAALAALASSQQQLDELLAVQVTADEALAVLPREVQDHRFSAKMYADECRSRLKQTQYQSHLNIAFNQQLFAGLMKVLPADVASEYKFDHYHHDGVTVYNAVELRFKSKDSMHIERDVMVELAKPQAKGESFSRYLRDKFLNMNRLAGLLSNGDVVPTMSKFMVAVARYSLSDNSAQLPLVAYFRSQHRSSFDGDDDISILDTAALPALDAILADLRRYATEELGNPALVAVNTVSSKSKSGGKDKGKGKSKNKTGKGKDNKKNAGAQKSGSSKGNASSGEDASPIPCARGLRNCCTFNPCKRNHNLEALKKFPCKHHFNADLQCTYEDTPEKCYRSHDEEVYRKFKADKAASSSVSSAFTVDVVQLSDAFALDAVEDGNPPIPECCECSGMRHGKLFESKNTHGIYMCSVCLFDRDPLLYEAYATPESDAAALVTQTSQTTSFTTEKSGRPTFLDSACNSSCAEEIAVLSDVVPTHVAATGMGGGQQEAYEQGTWGVCEGVLRFQKFDGPNVLALWKVLKQNLAHGGNGSVFIFTPDNGGEVFCVRAEDIAIPADAERIAVCNRNDMTEMVPNNFGIVVPYPRPTIILNIVLRSTT